MARRHNTNLIRGHATYTVGEIAACMSVHSRTVRTWLSAGLLAIDGQRPLLVLGAELIVFLKALNPRRQPLAAGEIFCVACKRPRVPADGSAIVQHRTLTNGDLVGTCPGCGRRIYRRVRVCDLARIAGQIEVRFEDGTALYDSGAAAPHTASLKGL